MVRCPTCGGRTLGEDKCVICEKCFIKRRFDQITCASTKCIKARRAQLQKIWMKKNRHEFSGAARFKHEYVICKVCGKEVQKIRKNQSTCFSKDCQHKRSCRAYRGIKAKHVRDLGQIQLP